MKRMVLFTAACLLFGAPGLAQDRPSGGRERPLLVIVPTTEDFVRKVAIGDMFEIQSSELAIKKADHRGKEFASRMISDHGKTSLQLKAMVQRGKVKAELPQALDDEHQKKLDQLKGLSGKDFDRSYDEMQQQAHEEAIALFQNYAQKGDNPDLRRWAAKTLPRLRDHLAMAKRLK